MVKIEDVPTKLNQRQSLREHPGFMYYLKGARDQNEFGYVELFCT